MTGLKAVLAAALLAAPLPARAGGDFFADAAKSISRLSPRARVKFVLVRSFVPARGDGGPGELGSAAAERLVFELLHQGAPAVIHASRDVDLPDAFVTGTYLPMGDQVQITITMTSAVSGRPLYTEWRLVPNEWGASAPTVLRDRTYASPAKTAKAPRPAAPRGPDCADWRQKADALQRGVLVPKARYWAGRAYGPGPAKFDAAVDPRRLIFDPDLRAEFDRSYRFWLAQRQVPPLSPAEAKAFMNADLQTEDLLAQCAPGRGSLARR